MEKQEIRSQSEKGKLIECTISEPLESARPSVRLTFEKEDGEKSSYLLSGASDLDSIGELFTGYPISIEKDKDSQMEYGTISVNVFGESYTEIFFDSVEEI